MNNYQLFLVVAAGFAIASWAYLQGQTKNAFDYDKYMTFAHHMDKFHRKLHGCDDKATKYEDCHPGLGTLDLGMWRDLQKEAKDVF